MNKLSATLFIALAAWVSATTAQTTASRITSTGVVMPDRSVTLAAKIIGRVNAISHDEAETVQQGETLLKLDDAELRAELASAQASLDLAKTELEQKRRLEARIRQLAKTKSVSQDNVDDAVFGSEIALAKVKIAEAQIAKVQAILKETRLAAPFDAVITDKEAEIGQLTQPGEPLFVLEDHSRLEFRTQVKEQDIPHIKTGDLVVVVIDALDGLQLEGTVSKIIPSGDPITHAFEVEVTLPSQDKLYPGMFGKAEFSR